MSLKTNSHLRQQPILIMFDALFHLVQHGTSIRREISAGATTFLTMAYILFVQPAMLSTDFAGNPTGLSADAVLLATCLASALATMIMGLYAHYPIALAPGMGQNAFFVAVIMALTSAGRENAWQTTLGIVFVAGIVFFVLSLLGIRELLLQALSTSIRNSIAVGIGLFIALIGLMHGGIIVDHPATLLQLNQRQVLSADWAVFWCGLLVTAALSIRKIPGSILWGILSATVVAGGFGQLDWPSSAVGFPQHHAIFQFDVVGALTLEYLPYIFIFLYMDLFDTMGTLIGVAEQADMMRDGKLPRARQAFTADAIGTVAGACMGTSTVTSYIESTAGVQQGGKTGLTAVTVAILFLLALPFTPLIGVIGTYQPITAPALVLVGAIMARNVTKIKWSDPSESIPSFLTMIGIPLCFSIADGIALGLISYPILKSCGGKGREVHWLMFVVAGLLIAYFVFRAGSG